MVINIGQLKARNYAYVECDIREVVEAVRPRPVKVILETGALTRDEKAIGRALAKAAGAAFVKTSTGFGPGGATADDVALLRQVVGDDVGVKASGGVRTHRRRPQDGRGRREPPGRERQRRHRHGDERGPGCEVLNGPLRRHRHRLARRRGAARRRGVRRRRREHARELRAQGRRPRRCPTSGSWAWATSPRIAGVPPGARASGFGRAGDSQGKDTTTGHWEMMGIVLAEGASPLSPRAFRRSSSRSGCSVGRAGLPRQQDRERHGDPRRARRGASAHGEPIVYTSADSVFQIAAHEETVPLQTLYAWCEAARDGWASRTGSRG